MKKKITLLACLAAVLAIGLTAAHAAQVQLPGKNIPQFVDPLPLLDVQGGPIKTVVATPFTSVSSVTLHMREFKANVMPSTFVPAAGTYTGTTVWGYIEGASAPSGTQGTYLGPVFVTGRSRPTTVNFVNDLGNTTTSNLPFWKTALDQTLHWADPLNGQMNMCNHTIMPGMAPMGDCAFPYAGPIPAVPHLHGGDVPPVLDGGPNAWFLSEAPPAGFPDAKMHGNGYYSRDNNTAGNYAIYRYPNNQEAAPIWFHDHLLGGTRLNVYAGLAGGYIVEDTTNPPPADLGDPTKIIPLILQDRMFDTTGELFFPTLGINMEHPFWIPEFVGDTIVVNGKVWPFLTVETGKRYRFLFINGSNARTYELFMLNPLTNVMGPPMWQIETDGGYLANPVLIDPNAPAGQLQTLTIMPGERVGVTMDFAGIPAGTTLIMRNVGRTPYPKGTPPPGATLGRIIQVRVVAAGGGATAPTINFTPTAATNLRPTNPIVRLPGAPGGPAIVTAAGPTQNVQKVRQLTLNEIMGMGGPLEILVNNTKWSGEQPGGGIRTDFTPVTIGGSNGGVSLTEYYSEIPSEGQTELWKIVNLTADAHPIHTHLTQFQLVSRQGYNTNKYNGAYAAAFPGGTFDGVTYLPGVFIPGFGPPLNYNTGNPLALGGNPDVTPFLQGPVMLPPANEAGWKDTIRVMPGQVTTFVVRYAPQDKALNDPNLFYAFNPNALGYGYVWHCHIIDHEDNEMMRPLAVTPASGATRTYVQGVDY